MSTPRKQGRGRLNKRSSLGVGPAAAGLRRRGALQRERAQAAILGRVLLTHVRSSSSLRLPRSGDGGAERLASSTKSAEPRRSSLSEAPPPADDADPRPDGDRPGRGGAAPMRWSSFSGSPRKFPGAPLALSIRPDRIAEEGDEGGPGSSASPHERSPLRPGTPPGREMFGHGSGEARVSQRRDSLTGGRRDSGGRRVAVPGQRHVRQPPGADGAPRTPPGAFGGEFGSMNDVLAALDGASKSAEPSNGPPGGSRRGSLGTPPTPTNLSAAMAQRLREGAPDEGGPGGAGAREREGPPAEARAAGPDPGRGPAPATPEVVGRTPPVSLFGRERSGILDGLLGKGGAAAPGAPRDGSKDWTSNVRGVVTAAVEILTPPTRAGGEGPAGRDREPGDGAGRGAGDGTGRGGDGAADVQTWPGFRSFLVTEMQPTVFERADPSQGVTGWGMTERERVYYTLFRVPWEVERMVLFGWMLACDSVLGVATLLPLRCGVTVARGALEAPSVLTLFLAREIDRLEVAVRDLARDVLRLVRERRDWGAAGRGRDGKRPGAERGGAEAAAAGPGPAPAPGAGGPPGALVWLTADNLSDLMWMGYVIGCTVLLLNLNTGWIYHYIRSQEVLKLYVVMNTIEILDKILCSFTVDTLQSMGLSAASLLTQARRGDRLKGDLELAGLSFVGDVVIAGGLCAMHSVLLQIMAITYSVAVNSTGNALLGLLIAIAFIEIKGTIFKKWDVNRLEKMTVADIIERFTLSTCLLFVLLENMIHMQSWVPTAEAATTCGLIFLTEQVVDAVKVPRRPRPAASPGDRPTLARTRRAAPRRPPQRPGDRPSAPMSVPPSPQPPPRSTRSWPSSAA